MSDHQTCAQCGRPDSVRPGRRFCSRECGNLGRWQGRRRPMRACETCGELIQGPSRRRFCSLRCFGVSKTLQVSATCAHCGTGFTAPRSSNQRFCSPDCQYAARTVSIDNTCVVCGASIDRRRLPSGRLRPPKNMLAQETCSHECGDELRRSRAAAQRAEGLAAHPRWGLQWTGPELELVATRTDLTHAELARMLGRTVAGVAAARHRVINDPKTRNAAGVRPKETA